MKKTWCLAAFAAMLLASCSNDMETTATEDGLTPILLGTGVSTKAPVNEVAGLNEAGIGIFGITTTNTAATSAISDWTKAVILDNVKPTTVGADKGIVLPIPYYYPATSADYVKFMAFHPYADKGTSGNNYLEVSGAAAPVYHFTLTGQEDLMWATPAIGNKDVLNAQNLDFGHKLTQITFKVIKDAAMTGELDVTGIQFAGVNTTGKMNIETGIVSNWATPAALTAFNEALHGGPKAIPASTGTPLTVGDPVMLEPGQASFKLNVATSAKTFENIVIKPIGDPNFVEGKSYEVTLTFNLTSTDPAKQIQMTASVQPWTTGGTGSGTVTDK